MDIQQYISSGILELYAAGALSPDEVRAVEKVLAEYPEVRQELYEIEDVLEKFSMLNAKTPGKDVRASLLEQINPDNSVDTPQSGKLLKENHSLKENILKENILKEKTQANVLQMPAQNVGRSRAPYYLAAASIAGMLVTSTMAVNFHSQLQSRENELAEMRQEEKKMLQENTLVQASLRDMSYDMGILVHTNTKAIPITPMKPDGKMSGTVVYWNSVTKDVYIKSATLPPPPEGHQYQLWAIANGKPMDEGVLSPGGKDVLKMKTVGKPEAFAVTIEPMGGSVNPTMEKMMWYGKL